jgi:dihydrofolate reductase
MRKLIVEEWISLDGYVSDKKDQLNFFAHSVRETYADVDRVKFLESIDCILMGRTTYEQFVKVWPQRATDKEILADKMNRAKKIVFSNTLTQAPWGEWESAEIATGNAVTKIKQLKSLAGKNMVLWASISLAQALMKENIVDEYHLHLCPVLTGGGRKFFMEESTPSNLKLIDTRQYSAGTVYLNYQPLR